MFLPRRSLFKNLLVLGDNTLSLFPTLSHGIPMETTNDSFNTHYTGFDHRYHQARCWFCSQMPEHLTYDLKSGPLSRGFQAASHGSVLGLWLAVVFCFINEPKYSIKDRSSGFTYVFLLIFVIQKALIYFWAVIAHQWMQMLYCIMHACQTGFYLGFVQPASSFWLLAARKFKLNEAPIDKGNT